MPLKLPPMSERVSDAFDAYPAPARKRLLQVRRLIFEVANRSEIIGALMETPKWGEPAYLTKETKVGSTLRLGRSRDEPDHYALLFNCNTTLVEFFRGMPRSGLRFEENRTIVLPCDEPVPTSALRPCIEAALTYHVLRRTPVGVGERLRRG